MGAGFVVSVERPGCWLLGPAWDTAPGIWGAAVKAGPAAVGWDVQEDVLLPGKALLRLVNLWAGDEGVFVARLVWAVLTTKAVLLGGEARMTPSPRSAFLYVPPSDLDLCLVWCLGM